MGFAPRWNGGKCTATRSLPRGALWLCLAFCAYFVPALAQPKPPRGAPSDTESPETPALSPHTPGLSSGSTRTESPETPALSPRALLSQHTPEEALSGGDSSLPPTPPQDASQSAAAPAGSLQQHAPTLFVLTQSEGYKHRVVKRRKNEPSIVERALAKALPGVRLITSQDVRDLTPELLQRIDAVFFFTTGELPLSAEQKTALLDFVRQGGGFSGCHSATDTLYQWPAYGEMLGAYFDRHPWRRKVRVLVEDSAEEITRGLGPSFTIRDEIYQLKAPYDRSKLRVLLRLDTSSVWRQGDRADRDYALAWVKEYGAGKVFYSALGHRPALWRDERFLGFLARGILSTLSAPGKPETES